MRSLCLTAALIILPLAAAESQRSIPLWDGHESVAEYAQRLNLAPTKSLDLGGGVTLDLVLIPAGQFIMGTPEPQKPPLTVASAQILLAVGAGFVALLLWALITRREGVVGTSLKRKVKVWEIQKFSFSLRWLLLFTAACGLMVGGGVRWHLALRQAERYAGEMAEYQRTPGDEQHGHAVTLTQPFYMGKYTVTQAQYRAVMGSNPSIFKGPQLPVEHISWDDASEFCAKLSEQLRPNALFVRLPTEAQWEYACRAGTQTRFYSGDQERDLDGVAWYNANSGGAPHPVGMKKPNVLGLYDMHGNVWQWCGDAYIENIGELPATDPFSGTGPTPMRIIRGGSWDYGPSYCRSAYRYRSSPGVRGYCHGFRICLPLNF